ncbi:MAG: class I tRNA ligase family protein, partial [Clostridia bacterium]|nr:class I tRNA ligase family protein [Clostridia bacterium]
MYKKVPTSLDFVAREKEILEFWKENHIFEKSTALHEGAPAYTFYDGPPTANGKPHIGHVLTRAMKDIIPRYKFMQGYDVLRKAGWDTHGLPVELEVEKQLGLDGKEQIEAYGVIPFLHKCKESVWKYKGEWEVMSDRMGFWADMENPYITYENDYIESEWWALKKIYDKGLLYKGHKIVPYCPRCGTALSSHEVAQGYKDVKETSATVRFKCKDEDASYLAWTTTPWTLPSNVCLCVNADVMYCHVRSNDEVFIMARDLVPAVLGEGAEILDEMPGSALVDREYEPLFACTAKAAGKKRAFYVIADDYVTTTDGTGIVHNAPAFGE